MNHQIDIIGQRQPNDFDQVASGVGPDTQNLGRASVRVQLNDDEGVLDGMQDDGFVVPCLNAERWN